jgi:hypothetical protein
MARVWFAAASLLLVACAAAPEAPPAHPSTPSKPAAAEPAPAEDGPAATTDSDAASEDARNAYLLPRAGEWPAESTPVPGVKQVSGSEASLVARCDAARDKAMTKAKAKPFSKQLAAVIKAMNKVDKRCSKLKWASDSAGMAKLRDVRAQSEMRIIAKGLATSPEACTAGAANPPRSRDVCMSMMDTMVWDREGWSCVQKGLTEEETQSFSLGAAYVYSFEVDPKLGTYEVVARGCQSMLLTGGDDDSRTELVLRGKVGDEDSADGAVYRRSPTPMAKTR